MVRRIFDEYRLPGFIHARVPMITYRTQNAQCSLERNRQVGTHTLKHGMIIETNMRLAG